MGNCLCVKPDVHEEVMRSDKYKSIRNSNEITCENQKSNEELDLDKKIDNSTTRVNRKRSNNKLSCDEYWDEIRKNTKFQTLLVKNDVSKILESKKESEETRIMTFQTNTNYSITIIEVNNKIVNPNEVFYVQNKENFSRSASPRPNYNSKSNNKNVDLDKKITDSIRSNVDFDKLYEDILSKHCCKK